MENALRRTRLVILCILLASCSALGIGITPIGDIVAQPGRFDGAEVRVKGRVASVNKLPLLDVKLYTLRDDSGEITVIAGERLPALDSTVTVRARVESAAIMQNAALGLRLREIEMSTSPF